MPGLLRIISFLEIMSPPADIFLLSPLKLISSSPYLGFISFVFLLEFPGGYQPPDEPNQTDLLCSEGEMEAVFKKFSRIFCLKSNNFKFAEFSK